ncbi:hypothetical protein K431DRAFT_43356 [Polychaeton citri CBS 116435]|uniref:Inclusion body clearance protein IML2 n=1 Tax=Polychaeton citri CBS 116435 TaxID=1314669 RepID=A0A9P4QA90_9PEZI|nr:hypothetical protein K431DRAFT_43356 [Polychaeton citri CBS 116435]
MAGVAHIMNDDVAKADTELADGTSPFHKLGRAVTLFLRATLGFEKEIMEQAAARLAEAEEAAAEHHRRAVRDPSTAHQSRIYPPGSEYALCQAEAQLMSAVVGVLNESLTESLRGFYKLRKAFATLHELSEVEKRFFEKQKLGGSSRASMDSSMGSSSKHAAGSGSGVLTPDTRADYDDVDDDLEFVDADEAHERQPTSKEYEGHLSSSLSGMNVEDHAGEGLKYGVQLQAAGFPSGATATSKSAAEEADEDIDISLYSDDPIDLFIHAGTSLCYGLLQLMLSMVPPAFSKLLSIFSFRGDRRNGLRKLWAATKYKQNINGALAGLITLAFHNGAIAFCDIITYNALPKDRLKKLLREMRAEYPQSMLWILEESRMLAAEHELEKALELTSSDKSSSLKQVEALKIFERSLCQMYLHRYEECAQGFIKCCDLNNWSHALYYYIAGICNVELYRTNLSNSDLEKAQKFARRAEELIRTVPQHTGKKRFMARQLPFDVFVTRKIAKWEARAQHRKCSLVEAIGVSPIEEMIYFWNGFKKMQKSQLRTALDRLEWSETQPGWKDEPLDEKCIHNVLSGSILRFMGETTKAKATLETGTLSRELHALKACDHADTWTLPVATYEMSVCLWQEAGGENSDTEKLQECSEWLAKVEHWESFDLDARVGMKVTTARETLKYCGVVA